MGDGVCVFCGEEHEEMRLEVGSSTVLVSCPCQVSVLIAATDSARYGSAAEPEMPNEGPCLNPRCRTCRPQPDLTPILRKVRWWVLGAGAFGCCVGFAVGYLM